MLDNRYSKMDPARGRSGDIPGISAEQLQEYLARFGELVGYIFSWIVLLPVAIIVSGKILASVAPIARIDSGVFRVPLYILNLEAKNDEVVLGFAGFFVVLLFVTFAGGQWLYQIAIARLGFDPGQFHTLCFLSALLTVVGSTLIWLGSMMRARPAINAVDLSNVLKKIENP